MKFILFIILSILLIFSGVVKSESRNNPLPIEPPKTIGSPTIWYRAQDVRTGAIQVWNGYLNAINVSQNTANNRPNGIANIINFNPVVRFDGNDWLTNTNMTGNSMLNPTNNTVFLVQRVTGGVVSFQFGENQTRRIGFENSNGNARFDFPNDGDGKSSTNVNILNNWGIHELVTTGTSNTVFLNGINKLQKNRTSTFNTSTNNNILSIGKSTIFNLPATVDFGEILVFNQTLSNTNRSIWESYLGIKYGITINEGVSNYLSSSNVIIWKNDANYVNNIFGIGRDSQTDIDQRVATSIGDNSLILSTNNDFTNANPSTRPQLNNDSYFICGNNGGTTVSKRWKAQNTGCSNTFLEFDLTGYPSDYKYLVIDDDDDYTNGITDIVRLNFISGNKYSCNYTFREGISYFKIWNKDIDVVFSTNTDSYCEGDDVNISSRITCWKTPFRYDIFYNGLILHYNDSNTTNYSFNHKIKAVKNKFKILMRVYYNGFNTPKYTEEKIIYVRESIHTKQIENI